MVAETKQFKPRKEAMQIQLKQVEIIEALKQYISKQGISLTGKTVEISFTAGRKDSGLSADISIEDNPIPGLDDEMNTDPTKPVLTVVKADPAAPSEPKAEVVGVVAAEAKSTTSLFGS